MVYVTEVHMSYGGARHEHIAEVRWKDPATGASGSSTRETMVQWIKNDGGLAKVQDEAGNEATVGVVEADPPYIRTYADGVWNDNLLALPRY